MASDGFEAVQRAIESKPDLVLLSVGPHKLNGVEAAKRISEAVPGVKLLFPTQNIDPDVMTEALSNGAQGRPRGQTRHDSNSNWLSHRVRSENA
jgi:DNA-binding NarL/FixJ family response regulator